MPPMKVTYPLTLIRLEIPGSRPLTERWNPRIPTEPVMRTHDPTEPNSSVMADAMSSSSPRFTVAGPVFALVGAVGA